MRVGKSPRLLDEGVAVSDIFVCSFFMDLFLPGPSHHQADFFNIPIVDFTHDLAFVDHVNPVAQARAVLPILQKSARALRRLLVAPAAAGGRLRSRPHPARASAAWQSSAGWLEISRARMTRCRFPPESSRTGVLYGGDDDIVLFAQLRRHTVRQPMCSTSSPTRSAPGCSFS